MVAGAERMELASAGIKGKREGREGAWGRIGEMLFLWDLTSAGRDKELDARGSGMEWTCSWRVNEESIDLFSYDWWSVA